MISTICIFCHTQKSYKEAIFSKLGKGKQHAAMLYTHWFKQGEIPPLEKWVEKQAIALVEEIITLTDFSLPELCLQKEEGRTTKFLLRFFDGLESESVLIPMESGTTLCISSQVGCQMGCAFCETGRMGLLRHLNCLEIVAQVFYARFKLKSSVRNIVFMGMGEPLDNFDQVMQAIHVLMDPSGLGFGPSRITVSTSGVVDGIYQLINEADPALNLAISINASNDTIRNRLMAINKKWNMQQLKAAMSTYCSHPRRAIFIEYVLIKGINDSLECAEELVEYLQGLRVKVNLIPYNPQSRDRFSPSENQTIEAFLTHLRKRGLTALIRHTKGQKIMAACGQLGNLKLRQQMREKGSLPLL